MALRFIDSFDHYATAQLGNKYDSTTQMEIQAATGRNSTSSLRTTGVNASAIQILDSRQEWVVGFGATFNVALVQTLFYEFLDSGSTQCDLRTNVSGQIVFTRNGTVLGTGTNVLGVNTFYYIEVKVHIAESPNGSFEVKLNGASELSGSGLDTQTTANATANWLRFRNSGGGSVEIKFDDYYICDTSGSAPTNDFLGDVRVEALFPNGNGNSSQWVGQDANSTDNYLNVDETSPDGDTTYNESPTVNDKDTYAYTNLTPTSGTVYGVQPVPYARKTDAGARSIASVARLSATEVDSANKALVTTYSYYPDIREAKPGGGVWTISDVNSAEFGQKVTV